MNIPSADRTQQPETQPHAARFVDSWASIYLDLLRAAAAFLVLLEHWRNLFFLDYPQLTSHKMLWAVPYILTGAGHQAVIVFFVLSGFFVGGAVFRAVERGQWEWRSYLLRRSVRLWIVLVPALLACLFWDELGLHLGSAPALYHGGATNHMLGNVSQLLSPRLFLINVFFLQSTYGTTFGSDGALWSLAYEFWYYLLFPLGLFALLPSVRKGERLLCLGLFVLTARFIGPAILGSFPIWLAGVLLLRVPPLRLSALPAKLSAIVRRGAPFAYALLFFYLSKGRLLSARANDYILTLFTFLFLWVLISSSGRPPLHSRRVYVSRELARFSYTLYAVHTPMMLFFASLLVHDSRWQPAGIHLPTAGVVLLAAVVYAYGIAWLTEFRTDAFRSRLERLLGLRPLPSALPSDPAANAP